MGLVPRGWGVRGEITKGEYKIRPYGTPLKQNSLPVKEYPLKVVIFEDEHWGELRPLVELRPVWRLSFGIGKLVDHLTAAFPGAEFLPRQELAELVSESSNEPLFDLSAPNDEPLLLINGMVREPEKVAAEVKAGKTRERFEIDSDGKLRLVWALLEGKELAQLKQNPPYKAGFAEALLSHGKLRWKLGDTAETGWLFHRPWELVAANGDAITAAFPQYVKTHKRIRLRPYVVGDAEKLFIESGAKVERHIVFSIVDGPIIIAKGADLRGPSRIEGPCYIGEKTLVDSAQLRPGTSIGKNCRVGGEVEESILSDHVNKHHYGFLGHAYVGEWVNLGAGVTNSDLKNTYGDVRVFTPDGRIDSKMMKVGCFIGDHVQLGIGTLIGTGISIGCFTNLYDWPVLGEYIPSFSWGGGGEIFTYRLDRALQVAERMMARRGVQLTVGYRKLIIHLAEKTNGE